MKKLFTILVATMMLAACQTTSAQVSSKQPPRVVTDKPLAATKNALIKEFKDRGFKVVRNSSNTVVVEQILTPNSSERKQHASTSSGVPRGQISMRFARIQGGTQVTATYDMLLNPGKSNQQRVTLLDSPDGARLQRLLDSVK
ncbi:hypothetical protein QT397_02040 (plasmid) [Microbulbifer sp. MKSA007]|nr:hypothetical protein QT397_02040 [Microbulbifer sp. MKSA007]